MAVRDERSIFFRVWDIVYPIGIYEVAVVLVMFASELLFGTDTGGYMARQITTSLFAIPVVYTFYRDDRIKWGYVTLRGLTQAGSAKRLVSKQEHGANRKPGKINAAADGESARTDEPERVGSRRLPRLPGVCLAILTSAALIGIGLNNLISMSPLISMSEGYAESSERFYASTIVPELVGTALLTPVAEELLYRGVVYRRLGRWMPHALAVVLSALIFGAVHGNLVQFIYAFCFGIALALYCDALGHPVGAMLAHMTANCIAVLRTETGWLANTMDHSAEAWGISVVFLCLGIAVLVFIRKKWANNP